MHILNSERNLQQRTYDGSSGQKWEFVYVDANRIKIRSALGTYIDNYGGIIADANNVWMYGETDSASQIWMLTRVIASGDEEALGSIPNYVELENNELPDGDYIIVSKQNTARNGQIVVAMIEGEATVKTFYKEKDYIRLQPENDTMDPIIVKNCEIVGKVVGLFRKIN